ncbi:MAG: hypothetical protein IKE56_10375 [Lachnospiraceae bacterium]|nr:hypothetical protein [Lachnospiraceae bacterium]
MKRNNLEKITLITAAMTLLLGGCAEAVAETATARNDTAYVAEAETAETKAPAEGSKVEASAEEAQNDVTAAVQTTKAYDNSEDGGHAITADGETAEYSNAAVTKTGNSEGDEADFYGENAAVFATNGAQLKLSEMEITTDGTHANAVFSYGEGTVVDISDSVINTSGNCSGGLMTTGGGTMNASDLMIHTTGNSSAAIRSDRGGGTVTVTGGSYTTDGKGSPAVYSTADIAVNDAELTSTSSEGIVIEGKNSVTLNNVSLNADHNQHNSNKSDYFHAVMIYQSMSGDADMGLSKFSATGGSITNANGDILFVNNTATDISLSGVKITNNGDGAFLRAAAAGWGREGSNGGKVNLEASSQVIDGNMVVDDISVLNLYLKDGSTFNGAINPDGAAGEVYVELTGGSKWVLTGDSYIKALTCDADSIDLNGYKLTVDGKEYADGTSSTGEAIEIKMNEGGHGEGMQAPPDGGKQKPDGGKQKPDGEGKQPPQGDGNQPPQKPDGEGKQPPQGDGNQPPQKPDGEGMQPPQGDGNQLPQKPDGEASLQ